LDGLEQAAERVARGDAGAFRRIVDSTADGLVRLAARMLGSVSDAEEVVQEAFVKAYRSLTEGSFDHRSSVRTWLYRIVTRTAIDALRSRRRRLETSDVELEGTPGPDAVAAADARVALRELSDWLDALPGDQRAAILLKAVEGLTTPEIAAILECSEGAVEQRLVRARATLRERRAG
jgi:RNA polymerase sigma-70 factor, ECF subfamily